MHIEAFAADHRSLEWLLFLFGSILLVLSGAEKAWSERQSSRKASEVRLRAVSRLQRMSAAERRAVQEILASRQVIAWPYEEWVVYLHNDGILWRSEEQVMGSGQHWYALTETAREALKTIDPSSIK
jgi:hypothetical protein